MPRGTALVTGVGRARGIGAGIATLISYTAIVTVIPALDRRQRSVNRVLASAVWPVRASGHR